MVSIVDCDPAGVVSNTTSHPLIDTEIAWLAGIIEGEGCLDLKYKNGRATYPRIRVAMTDEDVIQQVAKLFNRSVHKKVHRLGKKDLFCTEIAGRDAVEILQQVKIYFGSRRLAKANELIESTN